MSTRIQARPLFAATLTPHRSLSPAGKRVVIGLAAALALVPGMLFYAAGAWPVVGFMGLDVAAIWVALTLSMRTGKACEVVSLWPGALELRRTDARGTEDVLRFATSQVRFVIERDFNERVTGLWLREPDRQVPLGAFLSTEEKLSFSRAFGTALRQARG